MWACPAGELWHTPPPLLIWTLKSFYESFIAFHEMPLHRLLIDQELSIKINKPEWHSILGSICCQCTLITELSFNRSFIYSQAILSPSLWQVNSMALSTMARVTLRPGLSSSGRQRADTERKSTRHSLAAGTLSLGGKWNIIRSPQKIFLMKV